MRARDLTPRKHVHVWELTKDEMSGMRYDWVTHTSSNYPRRLERRCRDCGARMHVSTIWPEHFGSLPPAPLLALAELPWRDGALPRRDWS